MQPSLATIIEEVYKAGTAEGAKKGWRTRRYGGQVSADYVKEQIAKLPQNRTQLAVKKAQIRTDLLKLLREPKLSVGLKKKIKASMAELATLNGSGDEPFSPKELAGIRQTFRSVGKLMATAQNSMPQNIKVPDKPKPAQTPAAPAPKTPTQQAEAKDQTAPAAPGVTAPPKTKPDNTMKDVDQAAQVQAGKQRANAQPPATQKNPPPQTAPAKPNAPPDASKDTPVPQQNPKAPAPVNDAQQAQGATEVPPVKQTPKGIVETAKTWLARSAKYLETAFSDLENAANKWGAKLDSELSYRQAYNKWSSAQSKATKLHNRVMDLKDVRTPAGIPPRKFYDLAAEYTRAQDDSDKLQERFMQIVEQRKTNKSLADALPPLVSPYGE